MFSVSYHFDGLVQERRNFIANALELRLSCTNPSTFVADNMMTSSNGNIFRVTGHLCGEFTGPGDFPAHASDAGFWCFLWSVPEKWPSKQSLGRWFETRSRSLWRHRNESAKEWDTPCFANWPLSSRCVACMSQGQWSVQNNDILTHWPLGEVAVFSKYVIFKHFVASEQSVKLPSAKCRRKSLIQVMVWSRQANQTLPEPMSIQIYVAIWCQQTTMN